MIDLHCHILPGIDDGASCLPEALDMVAIACKDGTKAIVATPHVFQSNPSMPEIIQKAELLRKAVKDKGLSIKIALGAELAYPVSVSDLDEYGLNGTKSILIEFPYQYLPINSVEYINNLTMKGYYPIIAHPERNPAILRNPSRLFELIEKGATVQITSSSLTGDFGRDIQALSEYLLKKKAVHFIASDSHGTKGRRPELSRALNMAKKIIDEKEAIKLFYENPLKALEGKRINK